MFFLSGPGSATKAQKVDEKILMRDDSPKMSSPSATVTLVEFGDYQCPACGAYHTVVKQVLSDFAGSVNFVFRAYPLSIHSNANIASYAALAAGKQGKYWPMHEALYEKQSEWSTGTDARAKIMEYAKGMGLNMEKFTKDIDSDEVKSFVERDVRDGDTLGINATPTFFINAEKIENPASLADFESLIKAAIAKSPKPSVSPTSEYHVHANIKVLVDGTPIDFTQAKYQSEEGKELNEFIHFHDGKGDLVHIHKKGMTLKDLFTSLKLDFSGKPMALYVNGKVNDKNESYEPMDLDKVLVEVGTSADVSADIQSVANDACIYSLKCPERGTPPTENCVGGLGTGCEK